MQPGALEDPRLPAESVAQLAKASQGRGTLVWGVEVTGGVLLPPARKTTSSRGTPPLTGNSELHLEFCSEPESTESDIY